MVDSIASSPSDSENLNPAKKQAFDKENPSTDRPCKQRELSMVCMFYYLLEHELCKIKNMLCVMQWIYYLYLHLEPGRISNLFSRLIFGRFPTLAETELGNLATLASFDIVFIHRHNRVSTFFIAASILSKIT